MAVQNKTKQELLDELSILQDRVFELENEARQSRYEFSERMGRYFPYLDQMREAIYVVFDRKYEFVNQTFADIFGFKQDEMCHPHFDTMQIIAPESRRHVSDKYRQGFRSSYPSQQFEFTGLTKEGVKIECETFVFYIPYKWGVAIHGMLRNITVRKRIDQELERHRNDLQTVLNSIPTSIFFIDKSQRFTQVNEAFCKSLGFPQEHVVGKTLAELFPYLPADQLNHFHNTNSEVITSGKSLRGAVEIFPSLRGRRWIQNDRVPYHDEKGEIEGVMCLAIDISDLRETEEKLLYLSFHDALTGVYNRAYFDEEVIRLQNSRQFPISIIVVQVNNLVRENNRFGISAGNELLRRTGEVMKATRSEDVVARTSADRFSVLLPLADESAGQNTVSRLIESLNFHNRNYSGAPLSLSFNVATAGKGEKLIDVFIQAERMLSKKLAPVG